MGEINYAGIIVISAICIIIGASLLPTIGNYTGQMLNSDTLSNGLFTAPALGSSIDLKGQELLSVPVVTNRSDGIVITSGNYTIAEAVSPTTGNKVIRYTTLSNNFSSKNINISYTYGAEGYVEDAGSRAMIPLIIVFFALLIMTVALVPIFRQGFLQMIGYR